MPTPRGDLVRRYGVLLQQKVANFTGTADGQIFTVPSGFVAYLTKLISASTVTGPLEYVPRDGTSAAGTSLDRISAPLNDTTVTDYNPPMKVQVGLFCDMIVASTATITAHYILVKEDSPAHTELLNSFPNGTPGPLVITVATTSATKLAAPSGDRSYWVTKISLYCNAVGAALWYMRDGGSSGTIKAVFAATNDNKQFNVYFDPPQEFSNIYLTRASGTGTGLMSVHGYVY